MTNPASVKVKLTRPIMRGETEVSEFTLREPNAGALRGVRLSDLLNGDMDSLMVVLPRISEPPIQKHEIDQMGARDLGEVSGQVIGFFMPL